MLTGDYREIYESLPESAKQALLALSVLIERIDSLGRADRDDLFELLQEWRTTEDPEERRSIHRAMEEIIAQLPIAARPILTEGEKPMPRGLRKWSEYVGRKILELREAAGLTQTQLAEKAGLPQSHISRLERAEHSATHMTLEKIATALGVPVKELDPCFES